MEELKHDAAANDVFSKLAHISPYRKVAVSSPGYDLSFNVFLNHFDALHKVTPCNYHRILLDIAIEAFAWRIEFNET